MKSKHIVFVHGLFGWGPDELEGFTYWGKATQQFKDFTVHETSCGPVSSFHDRACEVFAQIKGTKVDYGDKHSHDEKHARFSDGFTQPPKYPLVPNWSAENPVILIGHSAGAQTCMQLQQLLADDFWGCGSTADWVDAIVCVAGLINGSTLPYFLGCDKRTGKLTGPIGNFISKGVQVAALASGSSVEKFYDFDLDQWLGDKGFIDYDRMLKTLDNSHFAKGEDNLAFDLSLQGCLKANNKFKTNKNTYYLSVVTSQTKPLKLPLIAGKQIPELSRMNPLLTFLAAQQVAMVTFDKQKLPIPGWGKGDLTVDKWQENDGAVSSISQRYPFTAGNHPLACK